MPRKKGFSGPKDPFDDLGSDFKDAAAGMSREQLEHRIAEVALNDVELRKAKKEDEDLKEKAEIHKEAAAVYRDGFKANRLQIEYMKRVLDDKGGPTKAPSKEDSADANAVKKFVKDFNNKNPSA